MIDYFNTWLCSIINHAAKEILEIVIIVDLEARASQ